MGFSCERAKKALEKHKGNVELAIDDLTFNSETLDEEPSTSSKWRT